jgi:hypothetical protein
MRPTRSSTRIGSIVAAFVATALAAGDAQAIINQVDGQIVPTDILLQACLNKDSTPSPSNPAPGEGRGVLNAVADAAISPQTFIPAPRASDGRRVAQFTMVGEGAGYQNRFGWYNVGDSPFTAAARFEVFACRDAFTAAGCECPCPTGPRRTAPPATACMTWSNANIVEVDFDCFQRMGRWRGGPVAFYIMTPELIVGGVDNNCADLNSTRNRVYSTDNTVNDDGDYVHFLIYRSRTFTNGYYFGWEDLFRGGDNDFEDALVRAIGLVPTCIPVPEVCDGRDNNCNGMIDEGLGTATCGVGACRRTVPVCEAGRMQTCTPGAPSMEICDNVDNNCDGVVDEGVNRACTTPCGPGTQYCSAGMWGDCVGRTVPTAETCDNVDNDCNGMVDDGLSRTCRTGCGSGVEVCMRGVWGACTAPQPTAEVCNGVDDDCNGIIDDRVATRPCMSRCGAGTEQCVGGAFVCNAPQPRPEVCDGADNNCDGMVDNGVPPGGPCGTTQGVCRAGTFQCRMGRYVCEGAVGGAMTEVCNGIDDNCNGLVDEGDPGGGAACMAAEGGERLCAAGVQRCRDGRLRCEGGTVARPEICNCMDDDCDGMVDEDLPGAGALCPGGGRCIGCGCRTPCLPGEFPCSVGLVCNADRFCVPPVCGTRMCTDSEVCVNDRCTDQCAALNCEAMGRVCRRDGAAARCVANTCYEIPCTGLQICRNGTCANNGCATMRCPTGQFCRPDASGRAQCIASCANVRCSAGQTCTEGRCIADPCGGFACPAAQTCVVVDGRARCEVDRCANIGVLPGRICVNGALVDDPCLGVTCPGAPTIQCRNGQCIDPLLTPLVRDRVVGSGGDCAARPGGGQGRLAGAVLVALAAAASARRRRRRGEGGVEVVR